MPTYIYRCPNNHEVTVIHGMFESFSQMCPRLGCKELMHRVPQAPAIHWAAGLPPHLEHTRPPAIQRYIDTEHQRRDEYVKNKKIYNKEKERLENGNQN